MTVNEVFMHMTKAINESYNRQFKHAQALIASDLLEENGYIIKAKLFRLYAKNCLSRYRWTWDWITRWHENEYHFILGFAGPAWCLGSCHVQLLGKTGEYGIPDGLYYGTYLMLDQDLTVMWESCEVESPYNWPVTLRYEWMSTEVDLFCDAVNKSKAKGKPTPIGFLYRSVGEDIGVVMKRDVTELY